MTEQQVGGEIPCVGNGVDNKLQDAKRNLHEICMKSDKSALENHLILIMKKLRGDQLKTCLKTCDKNNNNIFHLLASNENNPCLITEMMSNENILRIFKCEEIRTMLSDRNKDGNNVFLVYCKRGFNADLDDQHEDDFTRIFKNLFPNDAIGKISELQKILPITNNDGANIFHYLCQRPNRSALKWLCNTVVGKIDTDFIFNVMKCLDKRNRTIFHYANNNNETFTFLLELLNKQLRIDKKDIKELLEERQLDEHNRTVDNGQLHKMLSTGITLNKEKTPNKSGNKSIIEE